LDRHSIISVALLVIIALVALNYFDVQCNVSDSTKPILQRAAQKAGKINHPPSDVIQVGSAEPTTPSERDGEDGKAPTPGAPFVPPSPGSPGP